MEDYPFALNVDADEVSCRAGTIKCSWYCTPLAPIRFRGISGPPLATPECGHLADKERGKKLVHWPGKASVSAVSLFRRGNNQLEISWKIPRHLIKRFLPLRTNEGRGTATHDEIDASIGATSKGMMSAHRVQKAISHCRTGPGRSMPNVQLSRASTIESNDHAIWPNQSF